MRTLEIKKATGSLAKYAREINKEPVILIAEGKPIAALVHLDNVDLETLNMSTHPDFLALIERSRERRRTEGGISSQEVRNKIGLH
ncbi:MAG: hypothetical protein NTW14_04235 [bacterium]|nr:hypothetical protein [bacterium]